MNTEISLSELRPASFVNGIMREQQTNIIVEMISRCIKEEKRITIDEILECWFKTDRRQYITIWGDDFKPTSYAPHKKEEILKYARKTAEFRAKAWFMGNDYWLNATKRKCKDVLFAWGNFKEAEKRAEEIISMFENATCLGVNANGSPKHPLYISAKTKQVNFN